MSKEMKKVKRNTLKGRSQEHREELSRIRATNRRTYSEDMMKEHEYRMPSKGKKPDRLMRESLPF